MRICQIGQSTQIGMCSRRTLSIELCVFLAEGSDRIVDGWRKDFDVGV